MPKPLKVFPSCGGVSFTSRAAKTPEVFPGYSGVYPGPLSVFPSQGLTLTVDNAAPIGSHVPIYTVYVIV